MRRFKELNKDHPMVLRAFVGVVLYVLLGFALWWYISPEPGDAAQKKDFAQLMAQIAGGLALLFGLYFTWRRVEISQQTLETQQDQQVTERFTRAVEQLGATDGKEGEPKLEIRLGGIYALERIAKDSPERDYATIMEILTAYVRENASLPPEEPTEPTSVPNEAVEHSEDVKPRADIQAVLDVIGRRQEDRVPQEYRVQIFLWKTNLSGANLSEANLRGATLRGANLSRAYLRGANLRGAALRKATLREANLLNADLTGVYFRETNLMGANLSGANLSRAYLLDANLSGAKGLAQEQLEQAFGDESTKLPEGHRPPASWTKGEAGRMGKQE